MWSDASLFDSSDMGPQGVCLQPQRDFSEPSHFSKHQAVMIFPLHILEKMDVVDACRSHVIGMYDTTYPADCMELISVIVHTLRGAIAPIRCSFRIVMPHCATFRSGVLAYPHGLGIDTEHVLPTVYGTATSLRISSASLAVSLRRTLNCLRQIRLGKSSLQSLCRR